MKATVIDPESRYYGQIVDAYMYYPDNYVCYIDGVMCGVCTSEALDFN